MNATDSIRLKLRFCTVQFHLILGVSRQVPADRLIPKRIALTLYTNTRKYASKRFEYKLLKNYIVFVS